MWHVCVCVKIRYGLLLFVGNVCFIELWNTQRVRISHIAYRIEWQNHSMTVILFQVNTQVEWKYPKWIFNCFIENFSYDFIGKTYPIHIYHIVISILIQILNLKNNFMMFKPHEASTSNFNFRFQHHFRIFFKHIFHFISLPS